MDIVKLSQENFREIASRIAGEIGKGKVIAVPTDTVYGLVCDAFNRDALERIFQIKERSKNKPLPLFVKSIEQAKELAEVSQSQEEFLKQNWPGKVTVILKGKEIIAHLLYNGTIALRIPGHDLLTMVMRLHDKPLAQTSANISGQSPATNINEVINYFGKRKLQPDLIVDGGNLPEARPSTLVNLTENNPQFITR